MIHRTSAVAVSHVCHWITISGKDHYSAYVILGYAMAAYTIFIWSIFSSDCVLEGGGVM